MPATPPLGALFLLSLMAAACTAGPKVQSLVGSEPILVRQKIAAAKQAGPIPLVLLGDVTAALELAPAAIAQAADDGVFAMAVMFQQSDKHDGDRLLIGQGAKPLGQLCADNRFTPSSSSLFTAFCAGDELLGATIIVGINDWRKNPERLIWRSLRRLTEDDYDGRYGVNIFGANVGVSVDVGF